MAFSFLRRMFSRAGDPMEELQQILAYSFTDRSLLSRALSHRSSVTSGPANERLEYLGDAVLGLVVSEFLFRRFPDHDEGDLTKLKAALVNETVLSKVASGIGLGRFLSMSPEEEKSGGRTKPSIIADAMEAVFGAIYLDGGLKAVENIISRLILGDFENLVNDEAAINYKGELLEKMQGSGQSPPRYEVVEEIGPDHVKTFVISVSVDGVKLGTGRGSTKKEAEQKAARMALETLAAKRV